ncbi:hypothetical protein [uncultured Roseobacter sp.]|uniref:hypothetical protein n=1 Tax=uncultured Roseobacter sp. TaxID=114847 RepID=UPI0026305894|nr:hypothetical protein [uncultured Roseobacter sp.]
MSSSERARAETRGLAFHPTGPLMFPKSRVGANAADGRLHEAVPAILAAFHDGAGAAPTRDIARVQGAWRMKEMNERF